MTLKKILKKSAVIFLYILGFVLILIIGLFIFINTNSGKKFIKNKVQNYLAGKLKTKIEIGSIDYSLPKWIELKGIYLEDKKKDTLLYGEQISIDIDMLKLISGNTYIRKLQFKNIYANIYRTSNDSLFNYNFITAAFGGDQTAAPVATDTTALKLTLKELTLNKIRLRFKDDYGGSYMFSTIDTLNATLNKFQPDRMEFDMDKFTASGVNFLMEITRESLSKTDTSASITLLLKNDLLDLKDVTVSFNDKISGLYYTNKITHFSTSKLNLDMAAQDAFVDKIILDSSSIEFNMPLATTNKTGADSIAAVPSLWKLDINQVQLRNNAFTFNNKAAAPAEGLDFNHLGLQNININAENIQYNADSIFASVNQIAFKDKSGFQLDTTHAGIRYTNKGIAITELYIKTPQSIIQHGIAVEYDSIQSITTVPQHTVINASLKNTVIAVNDLYMLAPFVKKYLPEAKFKNNLVKLSTQIDGTLRQLNIPVLQLSGFSGSAINAKAILYNVTDSNNLGYDIVIFNSRILKKDILNFMPAGNEAMNDLPPVINIGTHLKGNLKNSSADINITSDGFSLTGKGNIRNIDQPAKLQYDVNIRNSRITKTFIEALVPPGTIPPNIQLPDIIGVTGMAKGDMNNIQTNAKLSGSYGVAGVNGYIKNFKNPEAAVYDLSFTTKDLQVGKLIKQDTVIGTLSFSGKAKGRGFNYKTMNAVIEGKIDSVGFKNYDYKNIFIDANLQDGIIKSNGNIDDDNLKMNYTVDANVQGEYPAAELTMNVDTIQLKPLNLYADTLNASFAAYINAPSLNPDNIDFYAAIDSSRINVKNKKFSLDSIRASAKNNNGVNNISFTSPLADMYAQGKFNFDKIGPSLIQHVDRYYNIADTALGNLPPQQITFNGIIKKNEIITTLVEGLDYDSIPFNGNYSSNESDSALQLKAIIPRFVYQTNRMSNGNIDIASHNEQLGGAILFDTLAMGSNLFYKTAITANAAGDSLNISALTKDGKDTDRYAFGAGIIQKGKAYSFSIKDSLLLNYQQWNVAAGNQISYSPEGILVNNFILSSDSTKIAAASRENVLNSPIDISIDNFKIRDITSILNQDTLLASGTIDGKFSISEFDKKLPAFTGNILVDSLQFMQQPVGNIKLFAEKRDENTISANMELTGNANQVILKGDYYLNNADKQFDADFNIANLNMATLQVFSQGNLARSSGSIKGNIKLDGKFVEPHWNGQLLFDSTRFSIVKLGTAYSLTGQRIDFQYPDILIPNLIIVDSAGNQLRAVGTIRSKSISEYNLNIGIEAKNFTLVNVSKAIDNQVYGFAAIDANVKITGNSVSPDIQGNLSLNDKSDVTMVLPESNVNKDAAKSVVRFIDRDTFALPEQQKFSLEKEPKQAFGEFLNYNLNIEVSKNAAVTVIIDPSSGDELKIQGDAQLNAGVGPGGNIILAGNYELNSGYYVLNYQFLRKQFNLLPGSTIAFSGDPTDAQINITAEYIANTSAKDLIGNEIGEVDPKTAIRFKQEIPFRVLLMLKGSMKKPAISFSIELPDENTNTPIPNELRTTIENKLSQLKENEAGTNKQVFSLLLFNRFVGEQSTDFFKGSGGSGGGFSDVARESVSKFLSSALDNIAEDLFKGLDVDLNLDTYKDYSSGDEQQKTDLNIAITKSFVNDRLSITVGRSFGIEGQDANAKASKQQGTPFLPDVTLNYKLTQDGKYLIRGYKKTQFEVVMDGYVIETGLAFVVTLNYDYFKELFAKKNKKETAEKK